MSSIAYGIITQKRIVAPKGESRTTSAPGMGFYLDALTALVPAEALALYAGILVPYATHTHVVAGGRNLTSISNPGLLAGGCAGLLALSGVLYAAGRRGTNVHHWDVLRFFVPPAAFAAWTLIQTPSVWDIWWPGSGTGERVVIAAFAAAVLAIITHGLGNQADQTAGVLAITGVSPKTGPVAGGQDVTLTGTGFTHATGVHFGQTAAPTLAKDGDTKLTVTTPQARHAETVHVTVTAPAGTSAATRHDRYTYTAAAERPAVTGVDPAGGPVAGGQAVKVTGTGFTGATKVNFGAAAAKPAVTSDTELTVTSPQSGVAGPVDVTVTNPAGTSATTSSDHYTYAPAPTVTNVDPTRGPLGGGQAVTVTGTGFTGATAVKFGATAGTGLTPGGDTKLTVASPPGEAGTVAVTVTTPAGTSATTPNDHYTYVAPPTVTNVNPPDGLVAGGQVVTVTGTGFTGATKVSFGTVAFTSPTVVSDTVLTVTSPEVASPGPVDVTVSTPAGTSATTPNDHYTYAAPPIVTDVNPRSGPVADRQVVTVTGTGFTGATKVSFGTVAATPPTVASDTVLTVTSPEVANPGQVHVTVSTPAGDSANTADDLYTYTQ